MVLLFAENSSRAARVSRSAFHTIDLASTVRWVRCYEEESSYSTVPVPYLHGTSHGKEY